MKRENKDSEDESIYKKGSLPWKSRMVVNAGNIWIKTGAKYGFNQF